jgi:hypothetical protein
MEVTLNRNGWHAKLHKWTTGDKPTHWSLCPYFWKTLLFIAISPITLLAKVGMAILGVIYNPIVKRGLKRDALHREKMETDLEYLQAYYDKPQKESWFERNSDRIYRIVMWLGKAFLCTYFGAFFIALCLVAFSYIVKFGFVKFALSTATYIGCILGIFAVMILILYLFAKLGESDTWSSIKGMAYSFKHKVCPAINWKEKQSTK